MFFVQHMCVRNTILHMKPATKTVATKNICIFGDSITYGAWDTEGGWADRLRRSLHARTLQSRFSEYYWVYNLGIPGDTSGDLLECYRVECEAREPNSIIFAIGNNDSSRMVGAIENRVPIERYRTNMLKLLRDAKKRADTVICVGLTPVDEKYTTPFDTVCTFSNEQVRCYDTELKNVCIEENISTIDIWSFFDSTNDLFDGLHPNDRGHKKIHDAIKTFLLEEH